MSLFIKLLGNKGESAAEKYLKSIGYKIMGRNVRVGMKEIDILAMDGEYIVFVEVKTVKQRSDGSYPNRPATYVDRNKKNNLILAAIRYMKQYSPPLIPRIDVIEVYLDNNGNRTEHIIGAVNRNDLKPKRRRI